MTRRKTKEILNDQNKNKRDIITSSTGTGYSPGAH
jgi:hypothetical protein